MENKIKILVIPSDRHGCGYFRSVQPHQYLNVKYPNLFEINIMYGIPKVNDLKLFFQQYQIVHIHKALDKDCKIANIIKEAKCKLIVDIDDFYDLGNDHPMSITAKKEKWKDVIINHLKLADLIITTTEIFRKKLLNINPNVVVIPNAINPLEQQFIPHPTPSKRLRFGIICGSSHLVDIQLLQGVVKQLPQDILNQIQFVLCGFDTNGTKKLINPKTKETVIKPIDPKETCWYEYEKILTDNYQIVSKEHKEFLLSFQKNIEYSNLDEPYRRCWTKPINEYATHYNNIDVLLVPLKENAFNQMKSQLKVVECGFFKKAIIAQNFGPYTIDLIPMIEKGGNINPNGNALLVDTAKNHKQWAKYITKLVQDKELLYALQKNLYNTVKDKYSLNNVTETRKNHYIDLIQNKR